MKNLYLSIVFAAIAFCATAFEPMENVKAVRAFSPMKATPAMEDIVGDYTIQYYDLTIITQSLYSNETTITKGTSAGQVVLTIPFLNQGYPFTMDLKGSYSAEDGKITFTSKGQVAFGADITFYLYDEDSDKESVVPSITCQWNGNGFTFNPNNSIGLPAGGNSFYFKGGYFSLTTLADESEADPMEGWTTVGMGKLMDGWLLPAFKDVNQSQYIYPVEIQSKDGENGIYRIVDPYGADSPVADINESKAAHGFIQFNIADPDHVFFYGTDAGFTNSSLGITKFYPNNVLGCLMGTFPEQSIAELLNKYESYANFVHTTFKDGIIELPAYNDGGSGTFINAANFGIQGAQFAGYGWTSDNKAKDMTASIYMPESGITNITTTSDLPVRYFNLQGIEVANPTHGIYIRTQGSTTTKVVL